MPQPTTEFWMETRSRTKSPSKADERLRKTAKRDVHDSARSSPYKNRAYVLIPHKPKYLCKNSEKSPQQKNGNGTFNHFQTKVGADSTSERELSSEVTKNPPHDYSSQRTRNLTLEKFIERMGVDNHARGLTPEESFRSASTEILEEHQQVVPEDEARSQINDDTIHSFQVDDKADSPVASTSRNMIERLHSDRSLQLRPTELVNEEKLHEDWVKLQANRPKSPPLSAHEVAHAENAARLRRFVEDQSHRKRN